MSAVAIVEGVAEGLDLIENLATALQQVSSAVNTAQKNGTPVDWSGLLSAEATAENNVLAAIADAKAAGK